MSTTLQESFDSFLLHLQKDDEINPESLRQHEHIFQLLSEYLIYYSDLFQAEEAESPDSIQDWESSLETFIDKLMQGDQDQSPSLEGLSFSRLDGEYLRDFIAWHLLRDPSVDSLMVQHASETLIAWLDYAKTQQWEDKDTLENWKDTIKDALPDAKRAAIAAHLLLYHIRLGGGVSPRLRGKRFETFKEGHARVAQVTETELWLAFDNAPKAMIGPILLPKTILQQLRVGDVIDIELGTREGDWTIVDIGPVYPATVYVPAEEMALPDKQL
ncbi:MAG: hypothetical protein R8M14_01730 [Ghiorsea sp.]